MPQLHTLWHSTRDQLPWDCLFVTPLWLDCVLGHLGTRGEPLILSVEHHGHVVGMAPLARDGRTCRFLGIPDVCDYQDVVVQPGHEAAVGRRLMDYLSGLGVDRLELETLRPKANLFKLLLEPETGSGPKVSRIPSDVTYEAALPGNWEAYLMTLKGKQRHEVRRKVRRLESHGPYGFRMADPEEPLESAVAEFVRLFQLNRKDKRDFMDRTMSAYFGDLVRRLGSHGMLRLCFLDVGDRAAASVLCFDHHGTRYLYNSGYDADFNDLSVGILSKVFSIRAAIEAGCRSYDFLKGDEAYKQRIGGKAVPLYRCVVDI